MRRVLIGQFGEIARLGLHALLSAERDLELVPGSDVGGIIRSVNEVRPDVVVLDLDAEDALDVARRISSEFPAIKVIACSSEEPVMQVFPPFHHGESYCSDLTQVLLASTLKH